jgi:hypothetical protein
MVTLQHILTGLWAIYIHAWMQSPHYFPLSEKIPHCYWSISAPWGGHDIWDLRPHILVLISISLTIWASIVQVVSFQRQRPWRLCGWVFEVRKLVDKCGTLVRRSLKLEIPTACHCACLIMAYVFLVLDPVSVVYCMDIYECIILPSSSSSGVISLQRKWSKHWCCLSSMRTRKNNDWNSQESWVSRASKGYLIELYICLFDSIRQIFRFYCYRNALRVITFC